MRDTGPWILLNAPVLNSAQWAMGWRLGEPLAPGGGSPGSKRGCAGAGLPVQHLPSLPGVSAPNASPEKPPGLTSPAALPPARPIVQHRGVMSPESTKSSLTTQPRPLSCSSEA